MIKLKEVPQKPASFVSLPPVTGAFPAGEDQPNSVPNECKTGTFTNPIAVGADPWVVRHANNYYVCHTNADMSCNEISVSKSTNLSRPGARVRVWKAPAAGWNSHQLWAPELHRFGNRWYIYYAAGRAGPPFIHQRSGVLESVSADPQGNYIDKGMLRTGFDPEDPSGAIWAIDVTVLVIRKKLYAIWSGWEKNGGTDKTSQHLFIAAMSNPWTICSRRIKISSADQHWEQGGPVDLAEGPQVLKRGGKIFIIYSTRESWTAEYRLGQLRLIDPARTPLDPANWEKKGPVFQGTSQVAGTGHASFTTSPDGKEWWILYHSKKSKKKGWSRDIRLQQFTWNKDGTPDFGIPIPPGKPMQCPGGEDVCTSHTMDMGKKQVRFQVII